MLFSNDAQELAQDAMKKAGELEIARIKLHNLMLMEVTEQMARQNIAGEDPSESDADPDHIPRLFDRALMPEGLEAMKNALLDAMSRPIPHGVTSPADLSGLYAQVVYGRK